MDAPRFAAGVRLLGEVAVLARCQPFASKLGASHSRVRVLGTALVSCVVLKSQPFSGGSGSYAKSKAAMCRVSYARGLTEKVVSLVTSPRRREATVSVELAMGVVP